MSSMEESSQHRGSAVARVAENKEKVLHWFKRILTTGNKRLAQKLTKGHSMTLDHAWIFQFVDIIYVATIFRISHLLEVCESEAKVYLMCFSYFVIMFSTRSAFDVYTCISGASGILHLIVFSLYGLGVFIMTVNISPEDQVQSSNSTSTTTSHAVHSVHAALTALSSSPASGGSESTDNIHGFGSCESNYNYDLAFAAAFIFTRIVIVIMYGLYFKVFHESNVLGYAPTLDKNFNVAEFAHTTDVEQVIRESMALTPARMLSHDGEHNGPVELNRPSAVFETAAGATRESVVERHFTRIFLLKVLPVVLSSLVMLAVVAGAPTIAVLPIAGIIEFTGDFLPSLLVKKAADWRELSAHRHFAQERLGLFFMLVMGEAMLGLSGVPSHSHYVYNVYTILIMSFITIFSLGLQFFEPLQTYIHPEGPHPLDVQALNPVYTWLVCFTCFFMLIASNGMIELYSESAHDALEPHTYQGQQKVANGIASVVLMTVVLKLLDKSYYRENLLPTRVYTWLNSYYAKAEEEEKKLHIKKDSAEAPAQAPGNRENEKEGEHAKDDEHVNHSTVDKALPANVSKGIRRILPLTIARMCIAAILYSSQGEVKNKVGFMLMIAVLVGFPSLMEVIFELRNFINLHRHQRNMSVNTTTMQSTTHNALTV